MIDLASFPLSKGISSKDNASDLNENQIVVGQVSEDLDAVQQTPTIFQSFLLAMSTTWA
jgi:hypothetical protein